MRVFWHQGGLHVHPESKREGQLLAELFDHLKIGKPPELEGATSSGHTSGGQDLLDCIVGDYQIPPSGVVLESNHKQTVIPIHKLR
jgi:hypothetical protein